MNTSIPQPTPIASQTPTPRRMLPGTHVCPNCGEFTLPLAMAVRVGQSGSAAAGLGVQIPNAEQVSRWLKPPEVPAVVQTRRHDIWGSTFFMAVTIVVIVLAGLMLCAILGFWIGVPSTLIACGTVYYRAKNPPKAKEKQNIEADRQRALALRAWDARMEVWERLGVCPNCGLMSDPVTGRTAEWHSVPSLFVG